jgi:hypothetical protein
MNSENYVVAMETLMQRKKKGETHKTIEIDGFLNCTPCCMLMYFFASFFF